MPITKAHHRQRVELFLLKSVINKNLRSRRFIIIYINRYLRELSFHSIFCVEIKFHNFSNHPPDLFKNPSFMEETRKPWKSNLCLNNTQIRLNRIKICGLRLHCKVLSKDDPWPLKKHFLIVLFFLKFH